MKKLFKTLKSKAKSVFLETKLKALLQEWGDNLSKIFIEEIRNKTLSYIESCRIKRSPYGLYVYSKSHNKPVLYASIYAALTRHLYRDLHNLTDKQRKEWIDYIQSFQDDDGLFKDPAIRNEIAENSDWWGWRHLTVHAVMALSALDSVAKKRFRLIEPFKDLDYVVKWLETRDCIVDPATTSNEIQNYFTIMQYVRDFHGESWVDKSLYK